MSRATGERDLEARLEALRQELAALIITLSNVGRRIENLADELRSRRQAGNVVALDRRQRGKSPDAVT
jgi:chromosomal replication initiation ATPase DnaA